VPWLLGVRLGIEGSGVHDQGRKGEPSGAGAHVL
jgi:hypothetical protein